MNDLDRINALYPSTSNNPVPQGESNGPLSDALRATNPSAQTSQQAPPPRRGPELSAEQRLENLYAPDGAGQPHENPDQYDVATANLFDGLLFDARYDRDEPRIAELSKARVATNRALHEYGFGAVEAKQLMSEAAQYAGDPQSPEALAAGAQALETRLRKEWGSSFDTKIAGAKRMAQTLSARIPGFSRMLENGLGNSEKLIKSLARAAGRQRR